MNLTIIRVALAAYSVVRYVNLGSLFSSGCFAIKGIIAGCSFSRAIVRVYCLPAVLHLKSACPAVSADFYIDDITLSAQAARSGTVVARLVEAAKTLEGVIHSELDAKIAASKGAIVASTTRLAVALSSALGAD